MKTLMDNKKGQTGGLITGLIFGVASLVIAIIIAFVIVSTLNDAEFFAADRPSSTTTNESDGHINITGYTLDAASQPFFALGSFVITEARNITNSTGSATTFFVIPAANFSVSSKGIVTNATIQNYCCVNFTYTYQNQTDEEQAVTTLSANFTEGVDNISSKIPTVLLVAAIVLILGVLAILVSVWQRMRLSGGSTL